ncbi:hypothetical protein DFJ74DRAFT_695989 [Hyaloraphidium curvatum]|nr:hypothetical protein DFJ74DRAFT_695989 [Hyaloraphidium curvatum]
MAGQYKSLNELLAAEKGRVTYAPGATFLLHVFWEAPSPAAAAEVLRGLTACAVATKRDTPCVPTYFFRTAEADADLCAPPARTIGEHPQLSAAKKKLRMGVPLPAVIAGLEKMGIDASLVDLDPSAQLPEALQAHPVRLEFTELYLDDLAMIEHSGSRDYLDGHAIVMTPGLAYSTPLTVSLGTPSEFMVEKILEPALKAEQQPDVPGTFLWRAPPRPPGDSVFLSLDFAGTAEAVAASLPPAFVNGCTTLVAFQHPLREDTARVMCVLAALPPAEVIGAVAALKPVRGQSHVTSGGEEAAAKTRQAFKAAGLDVPVNNGKWTGYVLHQLSDQVKEEASSQL